MNKRWLAVALAAVIGTGSALAGELEDNARALLEKNKQAVVTVQLVVKTHMSMMGMGSESEESKAEATGTVISPDGLTVLSLTAMDPTALISSMFGGMMDDSMKMESEVSDVKILADGGAEIPARVVLRDKDLDLGFVRPVDPPAQPMPCLDLSASGSAQIFDQVVVINRLGKVANRVYAASLERIEAIVEKPRRFYVPAQQPTNAAEGCPAFNLDGQVVGLLVIRSIKDDSSGGMLSEMMGNMKNVMPIILPVSDVLEVSQQAPARGEEPKEEPIQVTLPSAGEEK